ncbi:ribosome small subunit-dependent GTPase A [Clostridium fermenticellae]|uniref:Small ribosomal subunit biogenesis GTPase RsgA n=1 Tax=Clostridium fermenticellae TaxID=2068654 RepID=A0A386H2U2_9CLOT|nr:ribosome small subunit-dependent GTPase A [Clostridium fermenticellae]AYD40019.1 ribosome small subunit-dependent GTPase A [Clostridium fermenticellae]
MQGIITKGISGFYYIEVDKKIIECKARGKFRYNSLVPMVGDNVEVSIKNGKGVIDKIYPRKNRLIRPAVANVTQALLVVALKNPDVNLDLINRLLLNCEYNGLKVIVCFNKLDLVDMRSQNIEDVVDMIKSCGYKTIFLKAKDGYGIDDIIDILDNNVTVFCGASGVGKSTILNAVVGKQLMETGDISEKLKRGKHTTRHSEIIEVNNGFVVDTPGFSSIDIDFMDKLELQNYFPEFIDYIGGCKFTGCIHYKEPSCAVKKAVEDGKINARRYEFYIKTLESIINKSNKW